MQLFTTLGTVLTATAIGATKMALNQAAKKSNTPTLDYVRSVTSGGGSSYNAPEPDLSPGSALNGAGYNNLLGAGNVTGAELAARGIHDRVGENWHARFARIGIIDPYNTLTNTKEYLFFTKPDLHVYDDGTSKLNQELYEHSAIFTDAAERMPHVLRQLQWSAAGAKNDGGYLVPLLSNAVTGALDLPSVTAETTETAANAFGTRIEYRGSSYKSDEGYDFNIEFTDTKYLEVYMYFKLYDEYEKLKHNGLVTPRTLNYIWYKILHDQTAIYKFVVGEDGMTLIYWAKITGCFPTGVPRDAFGRLDGELSYSVPFHGQFVDDMNPGILSDFNRLVKNYTGSRLMPLFDSSRHQFNGELAKMPVIYKSNASGGSRGAMHRYSLRWTY